MESLVGKTIDNYKIIEVIGRGGMGVVLKALDMNLEKIVALKMIDPFLAKDEGFIKRFKTEARALAKLENPNIVSVYALRETDAGFFMVMEYVNPKTLSQYLIEKGTFSFGEITSIAKQLLNAIGHAHKVGVIHRDIKPSNILVCDDGKIKVMDFGLAKVVQQKGPTSTVAQTRAGTLYYMSPEQVKGLKNVDTRSDIYSIGMTLYEIVAGRVPFEKTDSEYTIQKHIVDGEIPSPIAFKPAIPKQLVKIILKAIDKNPEKRYQNITEMEADLAQLENQHTDKLQPKSHNKIVKQEKKPNTKKDKIKIFILSTFLVLIILSLIYFLIGPKETQNATIQAPADTVDQFVALNNESTIKETDTPIFSSLIIKTIPPGAEIFLDEKYINRTNNFGLRIDSLERKKYSIKIVKRGYEDLIFSIYPVIGENYIEKKLKELKLVSENSTSYIINLSMDEDGYIYVDGKKIPVSANSVLAQKISSQSHVIKFENQKGIVKEISGDGKNLKNLICYFQHNINIQALNAADSTPIWQSIYINDKLQKDIQTAAQITLSSGPYKVYVKREGYSTIEAPQLINISPSFTKRTIPIIFHVKKL